MQPRLTIQIVGWNSAEQLPAALAALREIPPGEVYIRYVDNASVDGSAELVRRSVPGAHVIELAGNNGFAQAHNIALSYCETPFVLVHNPDLVLDWTGVQRLLDVLEAEPAVGAIQGRLYRDGGKGVLDSAGVEMTLALNGRERGAGQRADGAYSHRDNIAAVTGAAGLYRMAALRDVVCGDGEVFDQDFFAYKEDVDLGWRLRRAGWTIAYLPVDMGVHERRLGVGTSGAWSTRPGGLYGRLRDVRTYYSVRNWLWMLAKNVSLKQAFLHEIFIDGRLIVFAGLSIVYPPLMLVWWDVLRGLPRMISKRTDG